MMIQTSIIKELGIIEGEIIEAERRNLSQSNLRQREYLLDQLLIKFNKQNYGEI